MFSLRSISFKLCLLLGFLAFTLHAKAQINPNQIGWDPSTCASAGNFWQPSTLTCVVPAGSITNGHGVAALLACNDTSGSGTAQVCATSPTFTPAAGDCITYSTTTPNSGTGLTLNVNSLGAKSVAKWLGTTTLAAGDVAANSPVPACYDGTRWNVSTIGNAPASGTGYANVFGSGSQTTVSALNTFCGSGTLYITGPLSIATGGTVSCPTQFSKAGVMTIASGQTVTFADAVTKTDAASQIFAGSGTVVFSGNQELPPIDWFGAVNYSSKSAAVAGTDSAPAIQACFAALSGNNQCLIPLGFYNVNSTLTDQIMGVGLVGVSNGNAVGNGGTPAPASTLVFTGATTADIIDVSPVSNYLYNNVFSKFALSRSAFGTGTSKGLSVTKCAACILSYINSNDSIEPFYLSGLPSYATGVIEFNSAYWGFDGLTASGTRQGFFIDTTVNPQSTQMNYNQAANNGGTGTSTGFACNGAGGGCTDIMGIGNSTSGTSFGSTWVNAQDSHWTEAIDDQDTTGCISVSGSNSITSIDLSGGWCHAASGASYGVSIDTTTGVILANKEINAAGAVPALISVSSSSAFAITGNLLGNSGGSQTNCISLSAATQGSVSGNTCKGLNSFTCYSFASASNNNAFSGNSCAGNQFVSGITFAASLNNAVSGNTVKIGISAGSTGISLDSSSNGNQYVNVGNTITGPATLISDSGTGNQFTASTGISGATSGQALIAASATTAASSKALAGGGSGLTTGPTTSTNNDCASFNGTTGQIQDSGSPCSGGSAFVTSLTTIGSSGPATVVSGVLNVPQYSGGGTGNFVNLGSAVTWAGCTYSAGVCTSSAASTITISAIPGTYLHLRMMWTGTGSGAPQLFSCQFNGDSTSGHYAFEGVSVQAGTVTASDSITGAGNYCGIFNGQSVTDFNFYSDTTVNKSSAFSGDAIQSFSANTNNYHFSVSGAWNNTAAITSITIVPAAGTLTGLLTIYGEN